MEGLSMNNTLTRARNESRIKPLPIIIVIAALALLVVLNVVVDGKFLTFQNFTIILSAATVPAFVAWGFSYLFACGITDLSAGAIIVLAATASAIVGNALGYVPMFIAAVLVGVLCLAVNMTLFQVTKIPPWIAGLGMTMVYETIAGYYSQVRVSQGLRVEGLADEMRVLGRSPAIYIMLVIGFTVLITFNTFPVKLAIVAVLVVIFYYVFEYTKIGYYCRAIGENERTVIATGINVKRIRMTAFIISGFMAALFGIMQIVNVGGSTNSLFQFMEMRIQMAIFLGGVSVTGGFSARIYKLLIGSFTIVMIENGLTLCGVDSTLSSAIQGILLMLVLFATIYFEHRSVASKIHHAVNAANA